MASRPTEAHKSRSVIGDETPMPPEAADEEADAALFDDDAWVEPPVRVDNGTNVRLGKNAYINSGAVFIDTCLITIGARTMFGPNVNLYSGGHPLDPAVRNGTQGPEFGKEITIGEDCWIGGNVTIVPGVTVGTGSVVGAGSVVTKVLHLLLASSPANVVQDVPPYTVVVGNPARKLKDVPRGTDEARTSGAIDALQRDIMRMG